MGLRTAVWGCSLFVPAAAGRQAAWTDFWGLWQKSIRTSYSMTFCTYSRVSWTHTCTLLVKTCAFPECVYLKRSPLPLEWTQTSFSLRTWKFLASLSQGIQCCFLIWYLFVHFFSGILNMISSGLRSSVLEHIPKMHKAPGSIPSTWKSVGVEVIPHLQCSGSQDCVQKRDLSILQSQSLDTVSIGRCQKSGSGENSFLLP